MNNLRLRKSSHSNISGLQFFLLVAIVLVLLASCSTSKNSYYFKTITKDTSLKSYVNDQVMTKIRKGDKLLITITSSNKEEDVVYNLDALMSVPEYEVSASDGNIELHKLGVVHAEGLTRFELKENIEQKLTPYLKAPLVTVRYSNRRITVLGELNKVQVIPLTEERITLLEALSISGDVNLVGSRKDILVFRENKGIKEVKKINLEDHSIFNSPWFYLQADDILYVAPDQAKLNKQKYDQKRQEMISIISLASTLAIIILDRIIKL